MSALEFILIAIEEWPTFVGLSILFAIMLFMIIQRVIVGGVFNPLVLILVATYSFNYAVITLLWLLAKSSTYLTALMLGYGVVMLITFRWVSRQKKKPQLLYYVHRITPNSIGPLVYVTSLIAFLILSLVIVSSIGLGILAETNRFDLARGFGAYIRVLDFLGPFIVAYSSASIYTNRRLRVPKIIALTLFILLAAMINGAKIYVLFSLFTAIFTLSIMAANVKIRPGIALAGLAGGLAFAFVALSINLGQNKVDESSSGAALSGPALVLERFVHRLVSNGDTSYLLLPNEVIDRIERDNAFVRFITPLIGITNATKILGYPVDDLSVGRQALLYYDPNSKVAGGPTSHFDLFGYVYFGPIGGCLFAAAVGALLGSINRSIRIVSKSPSLPLNHFRTALLATLWTRAVLVLVEPTVAVAYILDVMVYFSVISLVLQPLTRSPATKNCVTDQKLNLRN